MTVLFFIILYVWQNIEVMKIKLEYRKSIKEETRLLKDNDRLRYEIERHRRTDAVEKLARERGMKEIGPRDFDVMDMNKRK